MEYLASDDEDEEHVLDVNQLFCMVCGSGDDEPHLLICDGEPAFMTTAKAMPGNCLCLD